MKSHIWELFLHQDSLESLTLTLTFYSVRWGHRFLSALLLHLSPFNQHLSSSTS